jgi:HdeA/HdeB family
MSRSVPVGAHAYQVTSQQRVRLDVVKGRGRGYAQIAAAQPHVVWDLKGKVMSKSVLTIVAVLSASSMAVAAEEKMVVDMEKLTCGELIKLDFQDFAGVTMWLSGYYNSSVRNTVVDLYEFARATKTVKDYCKTNQRATVMLAAERALGIKMPR